MATITKTVCDKCGKEDAKPYWIHFPEMKPRAHIAIDLCAECASPLFELAEFGREESASDPVRRRRSGVARAPVLTQEEIDAREK